MTKRQIEELAKLYIDLGKLTFVSLVLGFFEMQLDLPTRVFIFLFGLTFSSICFIVGLWLFKEIK